MSREEFLFIVVEAARRYREEEKNATPRMIRGAKLHELGQQLDKLIEEVMK